MESNEAAVSRVDPGSDRFTQQWTTITIAFGPCEVNNTTNALRNHNTNALPISETIIMPTIAESYQSCQSSMQQSQGTQRCINTQTTFYDIVKNYYF